MPTDKTGELVAYLGSILENVNTGNGYFNDIQVVDYGITSYDNNTFDTSDYPRVQIICNDISIPTFSTKVASETEVEIKINAYLRKPSDIETSLESYQNSTAWAWDIRKAVKEFLAGMPLDIDGDLVDNQISQSIGFPMTLLTVETAFSIIFEECY